VNFCSKTKKIKLANSILAGEDNQAQKATESPVQKQKSTENFPFFFFSSQVVDGDGIGELLINKETCPDDRLTRRK